MKKLLSLSLTDIVWTIMPISFWLLVGVLWGSKYSGGFLVGYSYQFINSMLLSVFISGSLKSWISCEKRINYFIVGLLCYIGISLVLCICISLFGGYLLPLVGYSGTINISFYRSYAWMFFIDGVIYSLCRYFQYSGFMLRHWILSWGWFSARVLLLVLLCTVLKYECLVSIQLCNCILFISCIILVLVFVDFRDIRSSKLALNEWITREGYCVANKGIMFIIYLFGLGSIISDPGYFIAYNIMSMCTDLSWDLEGSIDAYVSIECSYEDWGIKKKKVFKSVLIYSILLFLGSLVAILLNRNITALWIFLIEMCLYIPDCLGTYCLAYVSIKNPSKCLLFLGTLDKAIRAVLQFILIGYTVWAIPISCFIGILIFCIGSVLLYIKSIRKVV